MKNKKINILQFGMTSNRGGMESYIMGQYNKLNAEVMQYDFVYMDLESEMSYSEEIKKKKSKIYKVHMRRKNPIRHYWEVFKVIYTNRKYYDAIVINRCDLTYVFPLLAGKIAGIKKRVIVSHSSSSELPDGLSRKILIKVNTCIMNFCATDRWACSKKAGKYMFKSKKFEIFHVGRDIDKFQYSEEKRIQERGALGLNNELVIGNIARFSYAKNYLFLAKIFRELYDLEKNARLLIVGSFESDSSGDISFYKETVDYLRKEKILDKVLFLGEQKNIERYYSVLDCFVMPSLFEGLPVSGVEAQIAGLPCLFSDTITSELKITDYAYYMSLMDSPKQWALKILDVCHGVRTNQSSKVVNAGFSDVDLVNKIYKTLQE